MFGKWKQDVFPKTAVVLESLPRELGNAEQGEGRHQSLLLVWVLALLGMTQGSRRTSLGFSLGSNLISQLWTVLKLVTFQGLMIAGAKCISL